MFVKALLIFIASALFAGVGYYLDWRTRHPRGRKRKIVK